MLIDRRLDALTYAAFLPYMGLSLNNQANLLSEVGRRDDALGVWGSAVQAFADSPGAAAELVAWRCRWRFHHDDPAGAAADATLLASTEPSVARDLPSFGRARLRVRAVVAELPSDTVAELPGWATAPIPEETVALVNAWAAVAGSRNEAAYLADHAPALAEAELPGTLAAMADLYPEHPILPRARAVLATIAAGELAEVVAGIASANETTAQVREWMVTPTWAASRAHFEAHRAALLDEGVRQALAARAGGDANAAQHLAILTLAQEVNVADLFDAVTDGTDASDLANDIMASGKAELLASLLTACPGLADVPFAAAAVTAVALALVERADEASQAMGWATGQGDDTQCRAFAGRLRRLMAARPDLAGRLAQVTTALEVADSPPVAAD